MRLGDDAYMRPDVLVPQLTSGVFPKRKAVIGAIGQSSGLPADISGLHTYLLVLYCTAGGSAELLSY